MGTITSADAVLTLAIPPLFNTPQQIQGFSADDVFDLPAIQSVETMMGVDGVLSGGFVYVEIPWHITLQGDSLSNQIFDLWWTNMQATKSTFRASGQIKLPSIATKYTLTGGFLKSYKPAPAGKKVLQPRPYQLVFERMAPSPT